MNEDIREAYLSVRNGCSVDVVIASPELNDAFLNTCRSLGLIVSDFELNFALMNMRKRSDLKGLPRSRRMQVVDQDEYKFASEIAARHLERRYSISLDRALCDPESAKLLVEIAADIAPGHTPFQYRWAALNLRKKKLLRPEILARVVPPVFVSTGRISEIDPLQISCDNGIYMFYCKDTTLYIGETSNLRKRLSKHLEHSDNKGLAHWLWRHGADDLHLEITTLPSKTETRIRKALELELITSRKPVFNYQGMQH